MPKLNVTPFDATPFDVTPAEGEGVRVVESQSRVATMGLVDTLEEQRLLEEMIEATKPLSLPAGIHWLIGTPFRYPPLDYGSRYGKTTERGIFYGSEEVETALAETAMYALLFLSHSQGYAGHQVTKTVFRFRYETEAAIDTRGSAFDSQRKEIDSPDNYMETQRIGSKARAEGIEVILFRSVRCRHGGSNLAVLNVQALEPQPLRMTAWEMRLQPDRVDFLKLNSSTPSALTFTQADFVKLGAWAHPAMLVV